MTPDLKPKAGHDARRSRTQEAKNGLKNKAAHCNAVS